MSELIGRRREDTPRDCLPDNIQPGDYWKVLNVGTGEPAHSDAASNLTGSCWMVVAPMGDGLDESDGWMIGNLELHTVREHEDGTISVRPGDGSSNSILITGGHGRTWHGYIERGVWSRA